ncbi:MAG: type II secretion system protein GspL [Pseudomonadota bacterium]|nr:type II secretion system protein GspL [Pseudomonadota bacterium]
MNRATARLAEEPHRSPRGVTGACVHVDDLPGQDEVPADEPVILLVPTRDVLLTVTDLRARRASDLHAALPYALEDRLAEPLEELHFVAAQRRDGSGLAAAVVRRERMEHWVAQARARGLHLRAALPDALALPWEPETWSVFADDNRVLVRTAEAIGFSVDAGHWELLLVWRLRECSDAGAAMPRRLRFWRTAGAAVSADQLAGAFDGELIEEPTVERVDSLWEAAPGVPIDLLGDAYREAAPQTRGMKRWLPALILFGLALVVHSALLLSRTGELEREAAEARARAVALFEQAFPEVTRIVDLRLQTEQVLGSTPTRSDAAGADFAALLGAVGDAVAIRDDVETTLVAYRDGQLEMKLVAPSVVVLDAIRAELERQGVAAQIGSAESLGEGRVEGQVRLQGSAP